MHRIENTRLPRAKNEMNLIEKTKLPSARKSLNYYADNPERTQEIQNNITGLKQKLTVLKNSINGLNRELTVLKNEDEALREAAKKGPALMKAVARYFGFESNKHNHLLPGSNK